MNKLVRLHHSNSSSNRGPGKVLQNLTKGLWGLGLLASAGAPDKDVLHGVLQAVPTSSLTSLNPGECLYGPNIFVLPTDLPREAFQVMRRLVVPSDWVRDLYRRFPVVQDCSIDVWPVGIDTEEWVPKEPSVIGPLTGQLRCLLYFKNRSRQDLEYVKKFLTSRNLEVRVLEYGNYQESEFRALCHWANFGVLLTNTESQGVAYMEMLSMDLPLFVFNQPWWNNEGAYDKVYATSVPYFDSRCGEITVAPNEALFVDFLEGVRKWKYSPRKYILENHTLVQSAQKYYNFLNGSHPKI